ncbi:MAG: anthranilate phosphoribosyltransferase [Planctomycetota bacterium]
MSMSDILERLIADKPLTMEMAHEAFSAMLNGECTEIQAAAFLTALRIRGETVDELVGAATVLREQMVPCPVRIEGLVDTSGTGGDVSGTFNISTATAIVVAGTGVPVSKHGNRSVSSTSGSADVFSHLGVRIEAPPATVVESLTQAGIAFFFAPLWHPAMRQVMPVRRQLHFRTIFNFLGPLCNPAHADFQLLGVSQPAWTERLAEALARLGTKGATIVCSEDGLDEASLSAATYAVRVRKGRVQRETWMAQDFGLPACGKEDLRVSSPEESATVIRSILAGEKGPRRDTVLANAAIALLTAGKASSLPHGVALAADSIDSGNAARKLQRLAEITRETEQGG